MYSNHLSSISGRFKLFGIWIGALSSQIGMMDVKKSLIEQCPKKHTKKTQYPQLVIIRGLYSP